ncbi:MAG: hypothetical protein AB7Q81_22440 [Gammaproteobacteria bacterium]
MDMKQGLAIAMVAVLVLGVAAEASAHGRSRSHFDFYFGSPGWWGPSYYRPWPPYYYYEPRTVIIEREPPVYIQRPMPQVAPAPAPAPQAAPRVWYYCPNPAGYYPYVQNCPQPWVSVDPSTVAPPPGQ